MRHYSDFWLRGAVLGSAWAERPDLPELAELDAEVDPLETIEMAAWLCLPDAVREAVVADYLGVQRNRMRKAVARR